MRKDGLRAVALRSSWFSEFVACVDKASAAGDRVGKSGRPLTLKGSAFHRITPECMMGGDIDGEGGESIYGRFFEGKKRTQPLPSLLQT